MGFRELLDMQSTLDPSGMRKLTAAFPEQMEDAWARGKKFAHEITRVDVKRVVVCGMGGSAIGGDMVHSYLGDGLRASLHVNRSYAVEASLLKDALFVFSSYSGNTGETLSAYETAHDQVMRSAAITSGGKLQANCVADGIAACKIPGGMPPRAAIAYSFFPLLWILSASGMADFDLGEFDEARVRLEKLCRIYSADSPENRAAELAHRIHGKLPFIYSNGGLFDAVARRWSCQFNENSKLLAHFSTFTENNHNEIVGWHAIENVRKDIAVIYLEDEEDHPMARKQADIALEIIEPHAGDVIRIEQPAGSRMSRVLSEMILGDFTSIYLAYLNGVDPTPVENIDALKNRLSS